MEPMCIVHKDSQSLVQKMFADFDLIRLGALEQTQAKLGSHLWQVKHKLEMRKQELGAKLEESKASPPPQADRESDSEAQVGRECNKIEEKLYGWPFIQKVHATV